MHPDGFLAVQAELKAAGLTLNGSDALVRMPKGFEDLKGSPVADAIRLRSFVVRRDLRLETTISPGLAGAIVDLGEAALPLLQFGWAAVDEAAKG